MNAADLREMGERDMLGRPLSEHQIEGRVFDCPHCGRPAYVMPMALLTYERSWTLSVKVVCPSCGKPIYVDISHDGEEEAE